MMVVIWLGSITACMAASASPQPVSQQGQHTPMWHLGDVHQGACRRTVASQARAHHAGARAPRRSGLFIGPVRGRGSSQRAATRVH